MKSESQWNKEVTKAFKEWKKDDRVSYKKFMMWNNYHKKKYLESKSREQGFNERIGRLVYG